MHRRKGNFYYTDTKNGSKNCEQLIVSLSWKTEGNTRKWNSVATYKPDLLICRHDVRIPCEKKMQGDVKESSDFFVPCSGVETFLYLLCKHHQHGPHHKALILHVNAMDKLPSIDIPNNHHGQN